MTAIPNAFSLSALLALLLLACWIDVKERRIPNAIVLHGLIFALGIAAVTSGMTGVTSAFAGAALGGALLLPYYVLGGMGAGDIKLMAMTGAYLGTKLTVVAVVLTLLSGVVVGFVLLLAWRAARSALGHKFIARMLQSRETSRDSESGTVVADEAPGLPYAVAILLGACATLFWHFHAGPAALS